LRLGIERRLAPDPHGRLAAEAESAFLLARFHLERDQQAVTHVGCCDDSPNTHATKHFYATGHPIIEGYDPPEGWGYVEETFVDLPSQTPQRKPIPRFV
jgi:hypothetical protein